MSTQEAMFSIPHDIPAAFTNPYIEKSNNNSESMLNLSGSEETLDGENRFYQNYLENQDDCRHTYTIDGSNEMIHMYGFGESGTRKPKESKAKRTPRPPNSFILYRKDRQEDVIKNNAGVSNKEISIIIGKMWKSESDEVKEKYKDLAEDEKKKHKKLYPDYKYQPRKSKKGGKSDQDLRFGSNTLLNPPLQTKMFHPGTNFAEYNSYSGTISESVHQTPSNSIVNIPHLSRHRNITPTGYNDARFQNSIIPSLANYQDAIQESNPNYSYAYPHITELTESNGQSNFNNNTGFNGHGMLMFNNQTEKDPNIVYSVNPDLVNDAIDNSYISTMIQKQVTHVGRDHISQEDFVNMQFYPSSVNLSDIVLENLGDPQVQRNNSSNGSTTQQNAFLKDSQNTTDFNCGMDVLENIQNIIHTGPTNQGQGFGTNNDLSWNHFSNNPGFTESLLPQSIQQSQFFSIPRF